MEDIVPGRAGVRAMALGPDGAMVDDFQLVKSENSIHVLNAPSPAATASLAIGTAVQKMVSEHFNL
jgi:L-2-hydroxyglutarate oxidase